MSSSLDAEMKDLYEVTYFDGNAEAVVENILENADVLKLQNTQIPNDQKYFFRSFYTVQTICQTIWQELRVNVYPSRIHL